MSGRFVRASKYRHVFGKSTKKEQCYDNLRITKNAWDTNLIKANPKYLSVNWEASGGGAFAVIPIDERGKLPDQLPLFRGHTAAVLDTDWSPFDDQLLASGSDDGKVFLWRVPDNFSLYQDTEEPVDVAPLHKLAGHTRKVGHVLFNPSAENVLASSSGDYTVKLWDVATNQSKLTLKHNDMVQSLSWSADGGMLVTTCRDKKIRFWDVRQEKPAHEVAGHAGAKNSRAVWMGEHDRVATTGFSRMSDRQLGLWDIRSPNEPIGGYQILDSISGVCMPFWDDGTQMLYLAGKGDGNIRYYEYENDKFEYLSEYKSIDPQRGIAFVPKRGVNTHENEVMRAYKTVNDAYIEPISFVVPRRAEVFQNDIYPPATGSTPSMTSADYFGGKAASLPPKITMESLYEGETPVEIPAEKAPRPAEVKATPAPVPEPTPTPAAKAEPSPQLSTSTAQSGARSPVGSGSMKDNQQSMSAAAAKFADNEEDSSDSDSSSFEEVPKPIERPHAAAATTVADRQEEKVGVRTPTHVESLKSAEPTKTTSAPAPAPAESLKSSNGTAESASASEPAPTAKGAAEGIKGVLQDIKAMLATQSSQIESLTQEVAHLKARLGDA